ncbi:MAG TPA: aminotransferase class V-fold PLP-dependent enzyme [Oculatellaceae cyanobacterium]
MQSQDILRRIKELDSHFAPFVSREFAESHSSYLNTGSCGKKPASVLNAIHSGWQSFNENPTISTFLDEEPMKMARESAAKLLNVPAKQLLLTQNSTHGLQLLLTGLLKTADELVTTDKEHGSVVAISRYLAETRDVVTHRYPIDPFEGSSAFCDGILALVTPKTKVVLVSQIGSYNTWRPNLTRLQSELRKRDVELIVDGAHSAGHGVCRPGEFRMWVGSGHKWLGGPNATGFVYVSPDLVPTLEPVQLGDVHYIKKDADLNDLTRFESTGTADVVRWRGLAAACELMLNLDPVKVGEKQLLLAQYYRQQVLELSPTFRTPDLYASFEEGVPSEASAMVVCHWPQERLNTGGVGLRDCLWDRFRIWVQPDFANSDAGLGLRVSCHYSTKVEELDSLVSALRTMIRV